MTDSTGMLSLVASNTTLEGECEGNECFSQSSVPGDPRLTRALREQLDHARSSTGSPIVLLSVDLLGVPLSLHAGSTPEVYEAIIDSGFGGTQQVIVSDLENDPRVPATWSGRGMGSSLSTPIEVDSHRIGVLHVIDKRARDYVESHCEAIADIAYIIGRRIEQFLGPEREERRESLMCRAISPAFAELRNALVPLNLGTSDLRIVAADLKPVIDSLADSQDPENEAARVAFDDLVDLIGEISRASTRVREVVMVVEDVWSEGGRNLMLSEILSTAAGLALHSTRLVGGLQMPAVSLEWAIEGRRSVVIAALSLLLSRAAESNASGVLEITPLDIQIEVQDDSFSVSVRGENLGDDALATIAEEVDELLLGDGDVHMSLAADRLCLRLTRSS